MLIIRCPNSPTLEAKVSLKMYFFSFLFFASFTFANFVLKSEKVIYTSNDTQTLQVSCRFPKGERLPGMQVRLYKKGLFRNKVIDDVEYSHLTFKFNVADWDVGILQDGQYFLELRNKNAFFKKRLAVSNYFAVMNLGVFDNDYSSVVYDNGELSGFPENSKRSYVKYLSAYGKVIGSEKVQENMKVADRGIHYIEIYKRNWYFRSKLVLRKSLRSLVPKKPKKSKKLSPNLRQKSRKGLEDPVFYEKVENEYGNTYIPPLSETPISHRDARKLR